MNPESWKIGILSDTHRVIPLKAIAALSDMSHIIHAGDVGDWDVILTLETLAPVTAVYGNCDDFEIRHRLPRKGRLDVGGLTIEVTHMPFTSDYQYIRGDDHSIKIFGHTHEPLSLYVGPVLVINPGSVVDPRNGSEPSVAILTVTEHQAPQVEFISIK